LRFNLGARSIGGMKVTDALKAALLSAEETTVTVPLGLYRGIKMRMAPRSSVQFLVGLQERETYPYIRLAARHAHWAIDIGAWHGELCLYLASRDRRIETIAVEPNLDAQLRSNIALNGGLPVRIVAQAIGTGSGMMPLDDIETTSHNPGFIRIDTDGAELDILHSGERMLRAKQPMLLIETHSHSLEDGCIAYISRVGYRTINIIPNAWWRALIPEQRPIEHNRWLWAQ
jgi:hypothetical protein